MRRLIGFAAAACACSAALAQQFTMVPEEGQTIRRMTFNSATGEWSVGETLDQAVESRGNQIVWDRTSTAGTFGINWAGYIVGNGNLWADFADIQTGTQVTGFRVFWYHQTGTEVRHTIYLAQNDNGGPTGATDPNDPGFDPNDPADQRQFLKGILWTTAAAAASSGYFADILFDDPNVLGGPVTVTGPDLDSDGRSDFGYAYTNYAATLPAGAGTAGGLYALGNGPNAVGSPGSEDVFHPYDPNNPGRWEYDPNLPFPMYYAGAFVFGAPGTAPFAQLALRILASGFVDSDGDGVGDSDDVCPTVPDPNQGNEDNDLFGDACDLCPGNSTGDNTDDDADGVGGGCDNCRDAFNPNQADCDNDGVGDVCDPDGPCTTTCPNPGCDSDNVDADFDGDCDVDLTDLAILLANFGTSTGMTNATGDTDNDGDADLTDLASLLARFGNNCNNP